MRAVFALRSFFAAPRSARQSVRGMDVGYGFTLFCNRPSVCQPPAKRGKSGGNINARRLAGVAPGSIGLSLCKMQAALAAGAARAAAHGELAGRILRSCLMDALCRFSRMFYCLLRTVIFAPPPIRVVLKGEADARSEAFDLRS